MRSLLLSLAQGLGIVMLADFVAGLVHWFEDAYGTAETPIIGPLLIRPNIVHHHYPRFFTRLTWWQSSWDLLLIGLAVVGGAWACGLLTWQVVLFAVVSVNANQVHKWSHRTRAENGRVISFLQDIRILQTPRQHALHHTDPKNTYYCPVTNLVNPLLERLQFWPRLEAVIVRLTGLTHRPDSSNRGAGPGPAWLAAYRAPAPSRSEADAPRSSRPRARSVAPTFTGPFLGENPVARHVRLVTSLRNAVSS
ncbi:MAG: hypothetical protein RLZZ15_3169 [Verrucomicrobiota bacterium]|jgi:ubiquitin-conjugating enzyme E2 variant